MSVFEKYFEKGGGYYVAERNYKIAVTLACDLHKQIVRSSEDIESGEVFDEDELAENMKEFEVILKYLDHFKEKMGADDFSKSFFEDINFANSRIENGRIIGDREEILAKAREWYDGFPAKTSFWKFEVANYIFSLSY